MHCVGQTSAYVKYYMTLPFFFSNGLKFFRSKNMGCSIGTAVYFFLSFVMTKYYKNFEKLVQFYNTFVVFGGLGLVGVVYFYIYLPDTDNKTLQEITEEFQLNKVNRNSKKNAA